MEHRTTSRPTTQTDQSNTGDQVRKEEDQTNWSDLRIAVAKGNIDKARAILTRGGDVNVTPPHSRSLLLHLAAEAGNIEMVNLLLESSADVNAQEARVGATTLHTAVQGGHIEVIDRLLAHPVIDPNIKLNSGYAAIHIAVIQENLESVKRFTTTIGVFESNKKVFGPLHLAAERGSTEIAECCSGPMQMLTHVGLRD